MPADILDGNLPRGEAGLHRGIAQVSPVFTQIFGIVFHAGEVEQRILVVIAYFFPACDQPLMQRVELVGRGFTCCCQFHCATAASISEVGVSALYSSSFGALMPS